MPNTACFIKIRHWCNAFVLFFLNMISQAAVWVCDVMIARVLTALIRQTLRSPPFIIILQNSSWQYLLKTSLICLKCEFQEAECKGGEEFCLKLWLEGELIN